MTRNRSLASVSLIALSLAISPALARAQTAPTTENDESARARTLFRQGAAAMKDGKYPEARKALLEAWNLRHTYDVAAILGQAELELKLYRDAAEHLDFAMKNLAPRESAETLDKIKSGLQTARLQVAELRISISEPNAKVTVDGQEIGTSPLPGSVFVTSGSCKIEARLGDDRIASQTVQASMGNAYNVELSIPQPKPSAPPTSLAEVTQPVATPDAGADTSPSLVPVIIGGSLFVAGAAMGIGYRVAASSSKDDLDALRAQNGADGCSTGAASPADCAAQQSAAEDVDSRRNLSTVGFVVAGAAAVGTAIYWFWPRSSSAAASARRDQKFLLSGGPTRGGGSLILSGSF